MINVECFIFVLGSAAFDSAKNVPFHCSHCQVHVTFAALKHTRLCHHLRSVVRFYLDKITNITLGWALLVGVFKNSLYEN